MAARAHLELIHAGVLSSKACEDGLVGDRRSFEPGEGWAELERATPAVCHA